MMLFFLYLEFFKERKFVSMSAEKRQGTGEDKQAAYSVKMITFLIKSISKSPITLNVCEARTA